MQTAYKRLSESQNIVCGYFMYDISSKVLTFETIVYVFMTFEKIVNIFSISGEFLAFESMLVLIVAYLVKCCEGIL